MIEKVHTATELWLMRWFSQNSAVQCRGNADAGYDDIRLTMAAFDMEQLARDLDERPAAA